MIPTFLQSQIDRLLEGVPLSKLAEASLDLSDQYRKASIDLSDPLHYLAYAVVRLPATFAAITRVAQELPLESYDSVLDMGSGPATSFHAFGAKQHICVEKDKAFIKLGKTLHPESSIEWIQKDFSQIETLPETDLALFSYSLNECSEEIWKAILKKACQKAKSALVIIEPGTKQGYERILNYRDFLIDEGTFSLYAPCPHSAKCPMKAPDWCHFYARLQRSQMHRKIKGGSLGYEDEKFSYLIFSHQESIAEKRILRHPQIAKKRISFELCTPSGITHEICTKSEPEYQERKKKKWGEKY